jgi:hypothetical protein
MKVAAVFALLLMVLQLPAFAQTHCLPVLGQGSKEAATCEQLLYRLVRSSDYPGIRKLRYWLFDARDSAVHVRLTKRAERGDAGGNHYPYVTTLRIDFRQRCIKDLSAGLLEEGAVPVYLHCDTAIFERLNAACFLPDAHE